MHAPHELEQDAETLAHTLEKDAHLVEHKVQEALSPSPPPTEGDEEDEGWASDRSGGEASSSAARDRAPRSQSPKKAKTAPKLGTAPSRRGRRRNSIRRGLIGHAQQFIAHRHHRNDDSEMPSLWSAIERGREGSSAAASAGQDGSPRGHSPPSSRPGTGQGSVRRTRIDHLKEGDTARDASPSRATSIRFADGGNRTGASTPRLSIHQSDSTPGTPAEAEDLDASRTRVTFDLPSPPDKSS